MNFLLNLIRRSPKGTTIDAIRGQTNRKNIGKELAKLVLDGKIQRIGDKFYIK